MRHHLRPALDGQAVNRALRSRGVKFRVAEFVSQPVSLSLVQRLLSEVGFAPSAASVEHVNGPTLPVISRSYVDTEFHGSLISPVVNFADSNESLLVLVVADVDATAESLDGADTHEDEVGHGCAAFSAAISLTHSPHMSTG
jgi:hypothetical protein